MPIFKSRSDSANQMELPFTIRGYKTHRAGVFRRKEAVKEALKKAMKNSCLSRAQIADELSRLVGDPVSESTINGWVADKPAD